MFGQRYCDSVIKYTRCNPTLCAKDVNWMYVTCSEDVLDVFWRCYICDALRDLVPFAQLKMWKAPWGSATFIWVAALTWKTPMEECYFKLSCRLKPATLLKVTLLHRRFSRFLNCVNSTKLRNASYDILHIMCPGGKKTKIPPLYFRNFETRYFQAHLTMIGQLFFSSWQSHREIIKNTKRPCNFTKTKFF